jgi:hypothetical protein
MLLGVFYLICTVCVLKKIIKVIGTTILFYVGRYVNLMKALEPNNGDLFSEAMYTCFFQSLCISTYQVADY